MFRPGDEVFGTCRGAFAEYAVARADRLASKPANVSLEEAAARAHLPIRRQLRVAALSPVVRQKLGFFISKERSQDLQELRKLLETGAIRPVVYRTLTSELERALPLERLALGPLSLTALAAVAATAGGSALRCGRLRGGPLPVRPDPLQLIVEIRERYLVPRIKNGAVDDGDVGVVVEP